MFLYARYLLELDCEGDPAWDCITNMCKGIVRLLQSSKDEFQSQLTSNTGINHLPMNFIFLILYVVTKALVNIVSFKCRLPVLVYVNNSFHLKCKI